MRASFCAIICLLLVSGCGSNPQPARKPGDRIIIGRTGVARARTAHEADKPRQVVTLGTIPILKTVLQKSPYYKIDHEVMAEGYYYHFFVRTDHGDYQVASVRKLIKLCREIDVVEKFREQDKGGHVMSGVSRSFKGVGVGAANVVIHPGQTVKRIGSGTAKFGRFLASPFRRKVSRIASDNTDRTLPGRGPAGGERRRLAYEMGIDVYTDNPVAQKLLNDVARKRVLGSLPINMGVFALPGGLVFTMSLTPMGFDPTTEELIRDNDPDELKRLNGIAYRDRFDLNYWGTEKTSAIRQLLDNPNYSPREQSYIVRYLTDMHEVGNISGAVEFLSKVASPEQASVVLAQMELLALLHKRAKPLTRFAAVRNTLGALARDGTLCLIISIDTVRYWSDVATSLKLSIQAAKKIKARKIAFYSTGDVDRQSVMLANSMGVKVYQNILENPIFMRPREGTEQKQKVDVRTSATPRHKKKTAPAPVVRPELKPEPLPPVRPVPAPEPAPRKELPPFKMD